MILKGLVLVAGVVLLGVSVLALVRLFGGGRRG